MRWKFFPHITELCRRDVVQLFECVTALPASLPERVNPVHETCAGLVCPDDLNEVVGVFYLNRSKSLQPVIERVLRLRDAGLVQH